MKSQHNHCQEHKVKRDLFDFHGVKKFLGPYQVISILPECLETGGWRVTGCSEARSGHHSQDPDGKMSRYAR